MITKKLTLINATSKGKILVAIISIEYDTYFYEIKKSIGFLNGKIRKSNHDSFSAPWNLMQEALEKFNLLINYYTSRGYVKYDDLTRKPIDTLSEKEINNLFLKFKHDDFDRHMLFEQYEKYANSSLERKWIVTPNLNGVQVLISNHKKGVFAQLYSGKILNKFKVPEKLKNYIKSSGKMIEAILNLDDRDSEYVLKNLDKCNVTIIDYVDNISFEKRLNELIKDINQYSCKKTSLMSFKKISGLLKIQNEYNKTIKDGYIGLLLFNPEKLYIKGLKSSRFRIKIGMFDKEILTIKKVLGKNKVECGDVIVDTFYDTKNVKENDLIKVFNYIFEERYFSRHYD